MFAKILPVLAAVAGLANAASSSSTCTQTTFTLSSQADIDALSSCSTLTGDVVLSGSTAASLDITNIKTIDGDLTLANNNIVSTLQSSTLQKVTGAFHLQNLTTLSTLSFTKLTSVGSINFVSLTTLNALTFSAGVTSAESIIVSDTFLSSLDGIDVKSAATININNNRRLVTYTSSIGNLSSLLNINANGQDLAVSFPNLIWIANMTISNVSSFSIPSLKVVNGSMRFDSNFFSNFSAPNLTQTTSGDVSFISNADCTNISLPLLTSIGGGFQIANNTGLSKVDGFGKLKTVNGAIKMRGNFTEVDLPSLADVKGALSIVSTSDITDSCTTFKKLSSSSNGGNGDIQGTFTCESDVANANSDTNPTSTSSSSTPSKTDAGSAAAGLSVNSLAVLGLAGVAAFAQLL